MPCVLKPKFRRTYPITVLVGAGAVVLPGMRVPPGVLALGAPAKVTRELTPDKRGQVARQLADLAAKDAAYRRGCSCARREPGGRGRSAYRSIPVSPVGIVLSVCLAP